MLVSLLPLFLFTSPRLRQKKSVDVSFPFNNGLSLGLVGMNFSGVFLLTHLKGILIQYFIQYGCSFIDGGKDNPSQSPNAFRIPWGIQAVPGAILFFGLFFFPKSPRWLASKDKWEECLSVLADVHGGGDANHPKVLAEYKEIKDAIAFEKEQAVSSFTALVKPRMFKRVILGMSIQMWSQLCGMNVMSMYQPLPILLRFLNFDSVLRRLRYARCWH